MLTWFLAVVIFGGIGILSRGVMVMVMGLWCFLWETRIVQLVKS